ncbi:MAG: neutral/alkaline non-lysosomal ceramidase N-terminal domain-containing protein [Isosphaeraceae bacterium]
MISLWIASICWIAASVSPADEVAVGFGKAEITPDLARHDAWIAGYDNDRKATDIHDPLWSRAFVFRQGERKIAMVSVDLVGYQRPAVEQIRAKLPDYQHVLVSSTHNHEAPDVIGLWGPDEGTTGVDPAYLAFTIQRVIESVKEAEGNAVPAKAWYGTAELSEIVRDSRLPIVKDPVLRVLRFATALDSKPIGLLVQWNCHPETLGPKNTRITADFPWAAIRSLERSQRAPVAYFSGAVGGLMTNRRELRLIDGSVVKEGTFAFAEAFGQAVARAAEQALVRPDPVNLGPIEAFTRPILVPLENPGFRKARAAGLLPRPAFAWKGDPYGPMEPLEERQMDGEVALQTEVSYLRLGQVHIAAIPGELYPELVYGQYQDPPDPNADFPDAPVEPAAMDTLPGPAKFLFGLSSDEIGYIVPRRQWDNVAPFAYGRKEKQYGEVNSVGPEVAPILMRALQDRVRDASAR